MKVAVIILNFNGGEVTLDCLNSFNNHASMNFQLDVIIVDNASTDDSVNSIKKKYPEITVLQNKTNLGFSEGNNVGIQYALNGGADYFFILNNDTILSKNCLNELVEVAQKEKKGGIFGPKIYFAAGFEFHKERYKLHDLGKVLWYAGGKVDWDNVLASHRGVDEVDSGQYDLQIKTPFVTGCAMFVRREVFETVGFFDPKFFLYYEDVDFCKRVAQKGWDILYVPTSTLWHKNAQTAAGSGSDIQSYYITRNRLLIGMRYAPWKAKMALFKEASVLVFLGSLTQKQAVGDFLRKKYGKRTWVPRMINLLNDIRKKGQI